ncbi:dipeptidase [Paenibacillus pini]|uniref:Microsomal dipeptidase n=1 Tax=Paenibacillus pini JCM 16418 TaxID=1236976 RepID=W7YMT6_9BACL|nr:membrane dipeptidase [Paenibacillus pini]GAF09772.1 microsomal dipeptidase [Paenibacillus pini JCM 16418]
MNYPVVDFHCDALSKMMENANISFKDGYQLDVTYQRMLQGEVSLQCFAIYLSERWGTPRYEYILNQVDVFKSRVLPTADGMEWLKWREQIKHIRPKVGQNSEQKNLTENNISYQAGVKGALKNDHHKGGHSLKAIDINSLEVPSGCWGMLSVEGADGFEGNLFYVKMCFELGVRFLGLTWNYANWAADGVLEKRNGGLTKKGIELVRLCNEIGLLLDVSHLSPAGFWELTELTKQPFIASHSNVYRICPHPRNLSDEQIRAIVSMDGRIGLTFVPWFVKQDEASVKIKDLLPHIEHICELGGENHLMFGSDFDGIESWVKGLEHPACYPALAELLLKHYSESQIKGWFNNNALNFLETHLPERSKSSV